MELGSLYNVRRHAWHSILLGRDASVLIVENRGTGKHNPEYTELTLQQRETILDIARRESFE